MTESEKHINVDAARSDRQKNQYQSIAESGLCPFCPEHYGTFAHQEPPIHESKHWYTIENKIGKYDYTLLHDVIITRRHVQFIDELSDEEWQDLKENMAYFRRVKKLGFGAVGMRFGDPVETGASVGHLHAHLVQPDPEQTSAERVVLFRMSRSYPDSQE